jgi:hypothetical protein
MAIFDVLAVLMVLAATFGWVNGRYVRFPMTVGVMAMGLTLSLALIALSQVYPSIKVDAERLLAAIDFDQLLLHGRSASCSSPGRSTSSSAICASTEPASGSWPSRALSCRRASSAGSAGCSPARWSSA